MNKIERIKELVTLLNKASDSYYVKDQPIMSDKYYDKLYDELELLEKETGYILATSVTQKVQGKVLDCFNKIEHSKPMLSAAKTKDVNEIKKFIGNKDFYCSYKLDGLTLVCRYSQGKFVQAITRGTGTVGEDVTEQARMISNLPMTVPYDGDLELRGECVISWENFHKINETLTEPYSHPRNLAAGSLRNLDTNITKQRNLSYVAFECVSDLYDKDTDDGEWDSKWERLAYLDYLGFETVERCIGTVDDCVEAMQPDWYKFPVDGLIFELNSDSYSKSLTATSHHEGCRIALKWADSTYETTLLNVEWNTTRSGLISPVAVFSPVDLDGAITTRATLHNLSIIKQLELGIGDTITVYRSNMVIPKVDENFTRSNALVIPDRCPCCGHKTEVRTTDNSQVLMCTNPNCTAKKIAQFTHFVSRKCLNIEGLSEATLEKFISLGYINDFKDIYKLSEHKSKLILLDGFGPKSIQKLLDNIEKSRDVKLENFIAALGMPDVGISTAKAMAAYCNDDFKKFISMTCGGRWEYVDGIGFNTSIRISSFMKDNYKMINELALEMRFVKHECKQVVNNPLNGIKFCITGSFSQSRDTLKQKLEEKGAKFVSSVSKNLDVLYCGDKAGSKLTKAQSLGVRVAYEDELMKDLGE